ncbi:hypothetical protein ACLOJK_000784 [Asimina triloba]
MGTGKLELRGEAEERFGNGKSSSSGRNMNMNAKGSFLCMPRLRTDRVRLSLLERFRAVVFKLIMLSAISKGGDDASCSSTAAAARPRTHHQYSSSQYYSEAVADCIEFIKKSAMDDDDSSIPTPISDHSLQTSSSSCHLCGCGY